MKRQPVTWTRHDTYLYCDRCGHGAPAHQARDGEGCVGSRGKYYDFTRRTIVSNPGLPPPVNGDYQNCRCQEQPPGTAWRIAA